MEEEWSPMTEKMLNLTLEIIYLLTGENYIAFKLSNGFVASNLKSLSSFVEPPSHSPIRDRNNGDKVQEAINKIIELLTGEVPTKFQDVTSCISMEEWEYIEGHKELYRDTMMENRPALTSPDGSSNRNTPERYPSPMYSRDSTQEHHRIYQDFQVMLGVNQSDCRSEAQEETEESNVREDDPCKEEDVPPEISTEPGNSRKTQPDVKSEAEEDIHVLIKEEEIPIEIHPDGQSIRSNPRISPGGLIEDGDVRSDPSRENPPIAPILHPDSYITDLSSDLLAREGNFPLSLPPATYRTDHREGEMFPCSICGICFTRRTELLSHQRSHTVEKPYACSECGKCFTQIGNLTVHMKAHTGGKPYSCTECGKSFCFISALTKHERIHTGEKPYSCSECGRCFSQRANLIAHQRTHTGEKPYSCLECGKRFTRRGYVIEHQRTHMGNVLLKGCKFSYIK